MAGQKFQAVLRGRERSRLKGEGGIGEEGVHQESRKEKGKKTLEINDKK